MSEFSPGPEKLATTESYELNRNERTVEVAHEKFPKPLDTDEIRRKLLAEPEQLLELPFDESPEGDQPQYIDRAMKRAGLNQELKLIREKLPVSQRFFSQVTHQPLISKASEVSSKTIGRPSGLLGGGILAFCGSLTYLLFSKYVGMKYNFLIFVILFVIGYGLSVIAEFVHRSYRSDKQN